MLAAVAVSAAALAVLLPAVPASAHVVPSTVVSLDVHERTITADLTVPLADLATASGIEVSDGLDAARRARIAAYLQDHFRIASAGRPWRVSVSEVARAQTEQWGTGAFPAVTAVATLTPPTAADLRVFTLDYDAVVHEVITADVFVVLHSDWAAGELDSARSLGAIRVDTRTGQIPALQVDLASGSAWQGFIGMVGLGVSHIAEGTDHQLFLLTLLLPAPLIAIRRRWAAATSGRGAVRRITGITLAFTVGHSVTLALGTLGVPVPQQPVEAMIAVSILVAAVHAIRPLFPGREAWVASLFGLVHGMAFSTTLSAMDLSGGQLALSLLGFNLGIELMQLTVVVVVLPPLVVLARFRLYAPLRVVAAWVTAAAAAGWLADRLGWPNPVAVAADSLGSVSPLLAATLWVAAVVVLVRARRPGGSRDVPAGEGALTARVPEVSAS